MLPKNISCLKRKQYLQSILLFLTAMVLVLTGCAIPAAAYPTVYPTQTLTPFQVSTLTIVYENTATSVHAVVPTENPTATSAPPTVTLENSAYSIPIIEYHHPSFNMSPQVQMQPDWFAEQLQWLADQGYTTLSANDLVAFINGERSFPKKSIVLSFDLGTAQFRDFSENVIPLLRQHGFQAVFFILVNNSVVRDDCSHPENVFCWDDLRGWIKEGLITIGSHGITHPDYATISADAIRQDMTLSKQMLEEKLGQPVLLLAYPYDSAPVSAQQILQESGYALGIAGNNRPELGVTQNDPQRYYLPRLYTYSSPGIYPLLYAYMRTFADVVSLAGQ